jgi:hypothetical protein
VPASLPLLSASRRWLLLLRNERLGLNRAETAAAVLLNDRNGRSTQGDRCGSTLIRIPLSGC